MAISVPKQAPEDPLNTVAVVPFDLTTSASTQAAGSENSLAAAASNIISAIAQGTTSLDALGPTQHETHSDVESDDGSSSFTYTAPASASADGNRQGWYASAPYHISNRYYDADITLKATTAALPSANGVVSATKSALSEPFPAYLVVVDRGRSLEHHRLLAVQLESKVASGFDADISIVAGVSLLSPANPQMVTAVDDEPRSSSSTHKNASQIGAKAKTSDLVALYADVGWEFIAVDDMDGDDSDGSLHGGSDHANNYDDVDPDDDVSGIDRIREALMNHAWNGLVRKDQVAPLRNRVSISEYDTQDAVPFSSHTGFSDSLHVREVDNGADSEQSEENGHESAESSAQASELHGKSEAANVLPSLNLANHVEATDLDEQLAKLFLASSTHSNSADLAELEAFLESEDPSWPAMPTQPPTGANSKDESSQFDDDFDDFLPFQSGPSNLSAPSRPARGTEAEDLPSTAEIVQMQDQLFGANVAARLEAGPLSMGAQNSSADQDLAAQLQQLQWHAQRVRTIQDPDQRRKEAALVALAFSMQWSTEGEDGSRAEADPGAMAF